MTAGKDIDEKEFLALIDTHKGILFKVSRMYFERAEDREDLYQEILLQAWKSLPSFKGKSSFSSWLYRIALNTAIVYFKKDIPQRKQSTSLDQIELTADSYDGKEDRQLAQFYKAVYQLDKIEKALILSYIEGLSGEEIAKNLGISPGNVRVKLNRTKNKLKELLNHQNDGL